MFPQASLILLLLIIAGPPGPCATRPIKAPASVASDDANADSAPIVERKFDFYDFTYRTIEGGPFSLRDYAQGKSLVIVEYFAGWCKNSNRNGHVLERLWTKYRERGLGVVGVAEYSDAAELRIHINRIGIDYPVVVETSKLDKRKDSAHYKYRRLVGDKRKWGTPFYVIIDARDVEAGINAPLARRVYTVSGELLEAQADQFIGEHCGSSRVGARSFSEACANAQECSDRERPYANPALCRYDEMNTICCAYLMERGRSEPGGLFTVCSQHGYLILLTQRMRNGEKHGQSV